MCDLMEDLVSRLILSLPVEIVKRRVKKEFNFGEMYACPIMNERQHGFLSYKSTFKDQVHH